MCWHFSTQGRGHTESLILFSLLIAVNSEKAAATVMRIDLRALEICYKDGNEVFQGPAWNTPSARGMTAGVLVLALVAQTCNRFYLKFWGNHILALS